MDQYFKIAVYSVVSYNIQWYKSEDPVAQMWRRIQAGKSS